MNYVKYEGRVVGPFNRIFLNIILYVLALSLSLFLYLYQSLS